MNFINQYSIQLEGSTLKAKDIIGYRQISQAFMFKIKEWSTQYTRFGFVQNSSNFYNEKSGKFQKFFFSYYQVENFYELSKVKDILFRKARESVVVTIFSNQYTDKNEINYFPVDMGIFSKVFDLLVIQEDKKIEILQKDILEQKINLRDYLVGNEYDIKFVETIKKKSNSLREYTIKNKDYYVHEGLKIVGEKSVSQYYNIKKAEWKKLNRKKQKELFANFKNTFTSKIKTESFKIKYIEPKNISHFCIIGQSAFLGDITFFERPRNKEIYFGKKILWNRTGGKIRACYLEEQIYFNFDIHVIKISDTQLYHLIAAILNSEFINYYLNIVARKRISNSFPKIGNEDFLNIPIPKNLDKNLVSQISEISKQLSEGQLQYEGETKEKLNELIYDLYELDILDIIRIKDFFSDKKKFDRNVMEDYQLALIQTIELFFSNKPTIEYYIEENLPFGLVVVVVYLDNIKNIQPSPKKTLRYIIQEILKTTNEKFFLMKEKIYGRNCIYIIKNDSYQSWSTTKAFEDGNDILKQFRS